MIPEKLLKPRYMRIYNAILHAVLPKGFQGYLKWRKHWKHDESALAQLMGSKRALKNPERIPLIQIQELKPTLHPKLYHYNPTLLNLENSIRVFWRMSNFSDSPDMFRSGRKKDRKLSSFGDNLLINGVATGELIVNSETHFEEIPCQEIVIPPESDSSKLVISKRTNSDFALTFEDPRALDSRKDIIVLVACESSKIGLDDQKRQQMAIHNLTTGKISLIPSPYGREIEKNWTPIKSERDEILFLYSSSPSIVLRQFDSGKQEIEILEDEGSGRLDLNGGSQFVLVDNSYYFRVARSRFSLKRFWKVHLSFIVKHDLNFREISRTKPFIFRKYAYEICNGLILRDEHFYFSWGENDEKMYYGKISKENLISWVLKNTEN